MDMMIMTKTEVWVNGKYLFTADRIEFKKDQKKQGPAKAVDSTHTGTVVNLVKEKLSDEEKKKQDEPLKERDYDSFFKQMVKRVKDPEFHIPVK